MSEHTNGHKPLLTAGEWVVTSTTAAVEDPATGREVARVSQAGASEVASAVGAAEVTQRSWARRPVVERAGVLNRLAELLERDREAIARTITSELGKPIVEARAEVGGAADFCRYFASAIRTSAGEIVPASAPDREILVRREPVGVVAGIIPWNYPLALAARKVAPALAAGNAVILKPSELTPLSALAFARLAIEAGVPGALLSVLPGPGPELGRLLIERPEIGFVSMTGSPRAGRSILHAAADRILPVSLELGGNAPFIVFEDADLDAAAEAAVRMRMMNCGQACVCNERTYVHERVFDEFVDRVRSRVAALQVGDPMDDRTDVGPKASALELANVDRIVGESVASGAEIVMGGRRLEDPTGQRGHWYAPTVLLDRGSSTAAVSEEIFGPVLPITPFRNEQAAIDLANASRYGLSSYFYTADLTRALRVAAELRSGEVFVNRPGPEEVTAFHGGWGLSGLGGDDGPHGLDLYRRKKSVYLDWGRAERSS
jgi:lactaldehyde dehydrogenase/glycolaldehyde dehydrogenase